MSDSALVELLQHLRAQDYRFTTVTPATHAVVLQREQPERLDLRDIFGWNLPFGRGDLDTSIFSLLDRAGCVVDAPNGKVKSAVRVASLDGDLFLHSSFPTDNPDSVFFGPDTYRFVRFLKEQAPGLTGIDRVVDMGAGGGAGGIAVARMLPDAHVSLVDVNDAALRFARANAAVAGIPVELVKADRVPAAADLLICNPPYLMDEASRTYRDGGDLLGGAIAVDWVRQGLEGMPLGGTILLYTGVAYVAGHSPVLASLEKLCAASNASLHIDEIDPDVFGEELAREEYRDVERIAAVGVRIDRLG